MKIASRFCARCPGCKRPLPQATFHGGSDFPWDCLACPATICCWCYAAHTAARHPNLGVRAPRVIPAEEMLIATDLDKEDDA